MQASLRSCQIHIDPAAIRHNLQRIRELAPGSRVMPVVKANGYGHGIADVVDACAQADGLAVAMIAEAVNLRQLGWAGPVVVFHGFHDAAQLALAEQYQLQPTVHDPGQLPILEQYRGQPLTLWLKIDTGMHRLGIALDQVAAVHQQLQALPGVGMVHLMSHFANADESTNPLNISQLENFIKVRNSLSGRVGMQSSLANSAAICSLPASHFDWVRPGIMLYGGSPLLDHSAADLDLRPAMRFESSILSLRQCAAGEAIGYGSTWTCPEDMTLGLVAAGYADGYPRHAAAGTPVRVNGQRAQLVGRVSMDSLYVDCRGIDASRGDPVELWGQHVAVDEVAAGAGTIAYELLCHAGNAVFSQPLPATG